MKKETDLPEEKKQSIRPEELRIGNIVKFKHLSGPIVAIIRDSVEVDCNSVLVRSDLSDIEGIPLSPEWLERLGKINWLRSDVGGYFFWFDGEKRYVKFLHTLQNVYFAFETKELCFDSKTQNT